MNKILISLILLCTVLWPCKAQLVGPGDKPVDPTTVVAKIGATEYMSLGAAFNAVNTGSAEPATIQLQLAVTLNEATSFAINKNTTLNLSGTRLDCPHGLTATVASGKVFTLINGSLSGSLVWDGGGNLFAGTDTDLSGLTVTKNGKKLYRVLVKLPADCGTVKDAYFGKSNFITFAQSADILCCWLPQHATIQDITFNDDKTKRYLVSGVIVNQHTATTPDAVENPAPDLDIAEVSSTGSDHWTKYETLKLAFNALSAQNGTIRLRSKASFAESLSIAKEIVFNLNTYQLTAASGAAFKTTGKLHVKNGELSGLLKIEGDVVIDKSVVMAGATVLNSGGASVYRVRLVLPADVAGKTLTYSYNGQADISIGRIFTENTETIAYLWLPANSIGKTFTLTVTDGPSSIPINKNDITINTNHDNTINLVTGDMEAELDVDGVKTQYTTFHKALEAAKNANKNCTVTLLNNVGLSGGTPHAHALVASQIVTIDLNGHNLTGGNCWLDATANQSVYIIADTQNTGSLTGQIQIDGCVYIKDIAASKIGQVVDKDATATPLYRLMATIAGSAERGLVTYTWDGGTPTVAYAVDGKVCLFQTAGSTQHALNIKAADRKTYSTSGIILSASHSNVTTVRLPGEVASIGSDKFASLADALTAANTTSGAVTIELTNHATLDNKQTISQEITIDLKEFTLAMGSNSEWEVTGGNSLYIKSTPKTATIQGNFKVSDNVCISTDVTISGSVTKDRKSVYRTRFFLPSTTKAATYAFKLQTGNLIFPGETRDNGQEVGYAFLQVESGYADLTTTITNPTLSPDSYTLRQVFLQAFHNNQFDMQAGDNVVEVNNIKYSLFSAALIIANQNGGTIKLLRNITLSGIQGVTNNVTIDLTGYTLNMTDDASFNIAGTNTLTIKDSEPTKGFLYGIYRLQGSLFVTSDVNIAGTVVHEGHELYRRIVKGIGDNTYDGTSAYKAGSADLTTSIQKGIGCFWLPAISTEQDLAITAGTDTYEATLLPALPNHNSQVQAYKRVEVTADETWSNADNANTNVYLKAGVKLTLDITTGLDKFSLHHITMENGAEIITNQPLLATEGIVYRYSFGVANQWYPFSVPYNVRMIRRSVDGVQSEIQPYLADGTGGYFWLKTLSAEGGFQFMAEEKVKANVGYVMAVPANLTTGQNAFIDFLSPANQFLNRKQVALPTIQTGKFYLVAPGTLQSVKLGQSIYLLNADGEEFRLTNASAMNKVSVSPFTSFLLADAQTMSTNSRLKMGQFPTAVEPTAPVSDPLLITSGKGYIRMESAVETLLAIYTCDGKLVSLRRIPSGTTELPLQAGLYFVNRQKVIVR